MRHRRCAADRPDIPRVLCEFHPAFRIRAAGRRQLRVFYRVDEAAELAWHSGPEMQLLDDAVHPDGAEPTTRNGALYGLRATQQETPIKPGSFMEGALVVRDAEIEHWLDNRMVLSYRLDDPDLRMQIRTSKFADKPLYAQATAGHIVLQHHGEAVRFRRLSIEPLS